MTTMPTDDSTAVALVEAIHAGEVEALKELIDRQPDLATVPLGVEDDMTRSLLHVVTDWPVNFPNGAATVRALVAAGADVNARLTGPHEETPLHWAASSDDVAVLDAQLDAGADIEAPGGVIGNGTPISDATAFGQWDAARRLVERGARTNLWESATLGLMDRVKGFFKTEPPPDREDITSSFWGACHGGQLDAATYLLDRGADLNWVGYDDLTPLDAARRSNANDVVDWLLQRGGISAS
jgi:ankyrin repeat protein